MVGVTLIDEKPEPVLHWYVSIPDALRLTFIPLHTAVELLTVKLGSNTLTVIIVELAQVFVPVPTTA